MSVDVDAWGLDDPRRSPAEYAVELARDPFWRDERLRLIGTHPGFPDAAYFIGLSDREHLAHALVLVLSRLPQERRLPFAETFLDELPERSGGGSGAAAAAPAAAIALLVVDLAADALRDERVVDFLAALAQGDDLTHTPEPAVAELRKALARVRLDVSLEDLSDPRAAASFAAVESLDPAGDVVELKAVAAHAAWAAVESWDPPRVLAFLLQAGAVS